MLGILLLSFDWIFLKLRLGPFKYYLICTQIISFKCLFFPKINIREKREKIEEYTVEDFEISEYVSHENISMNMHA